MPYSALDHLFNLRRRKSSFHCKNKVFQVQEIAEIEHVGSRLPALYPGLTDKPQALKRQDLANFSRLLNAKLTTPPSVEI